MSYANVGRIWSNSSFKDYLKTVKKPSWAWAVVLHHTAAPSLATRPKGLLAEHITNISNYYKKKLGWNRGPHLFVDEDQIFGMTPLTIAGIHAASFNSYSIGIEVLGNYDIEDPHSGRGADAWRVTAQCTADLLEWMGVAASTKTILFHRDDPKTSKTCPGKKIQKDWFIDLVKNNTVLVSPPITPLEGLEQDKFEGVVDFMVRERKVNHTTATKSLKRNGRLYFYNNHWLERAYYDLDKQQTVAPISELKEALATFK
jgi:hypothetical protein